MILDGRAIAEDLYVELAERRRSIVSDVKLGIVVVGENPVIASFVRIKERAATRLGVTMVRIDLPADASQEVIIGSIQDVAMRSDGVIAQLPFPKGVDVDAVLSAVPVEKDVDALNPTISENKRLVHAPVALAVVELLQRAGIEIPGKRTVGVASWESWRECIHIFSGGGLHRGFKRRGHHCFRSWKSRIYQARTS